MAIKQVVLLPGMDGTGQLFAEFVSSLPHPFVATSVSYPPDRFLSYAELLPFVSAAVPKKEPFALLAESFSTPLALAYAATNPPNLAALVICAGFVGSPIGGWSRLVRPLVRPWLFRLTPPRWFLEHFLVGEHAPPELIQRVRRALQSVSPEVLRRRLNAILDCDARNDLVGAGIPMMYVQGVNDRLVAASCHEDISAVRPDITFAAIPAPHLVLQREPQKAADLIVAFIERLPR